MCAKMLLLVVVLAVLASVSLDVIAELCEHGAVKLVSQLYPVNDVSIFHIIIYNYYSNYHTEDHWLTILWCS